jgi:hypothetical protein
MFGVVHGHVAEGEQLVDCHGVPEVFLLAEVLGEVGFGGEDVESAVVLRDAEDKGQLGQSGLPSCRCACRGAGFRAWPRPCSARV